MKICILSMQRVLNYGSLLQAYSLKKLLKEMGHEVSFIDIEPNEEENKLLNNNSRHYEEGLQTGGKSIFHRLCQQDTVLLFALSKIINKKRTDQKQRDFAKKYLALNKENNNRQYDGCVIGSDEVFNFLNETPWGFTSQLFGNVPQAQKVITYAASCGFSRFDDLTEELKCVITRSFQRIHAFSVRDKNTALFVKQLTGVDPAVNLDPVLVGDFSQEIARAEQSLRLPKKFCIIYAYHGRIDSQEEIDAIVALCKKEGMTLVSVGGYQKWVHRHLALTPFEVLAAFKKASFVITDTFHGTIFSAKYAGRFAVIVRDSNQNKLGDLVDRLSLQNHVVDQDKKLEDVLKETNDFRRIESLIKRHREQTLDYLEQNI